MENFCVSILFVDLPNYKLLLRAKTDESLCFGEVTNVDHCLSMDGEPAVELVKPAQVEKSDGTLAHSEDKEFLHVCFDFF